VAFPGKTIIITGASDGIGAELARQLAVPGAQLVLAARGQDKLDAVAGECTQAGAQVLAVRTDVSVEADCKALINACVAKFGGVDALVNNAGVSMHAWFEDITDFSTFEALFRTNTLSAIWLSRDALPFLKQSHGLIVGVSSLAGKTGVPARTTYCASKFAMSGFFEALRIELAGGGVDVTMIYPGVVDTHIRRNGLKGDGSRAGVSGLSETGAMSVHECARQMVVAMTKRKRELIMTPKGKFGMLLKAFAPSLVDNMARKALSQEGKKS
jgi:short-subunit dehydrogenase